MQVAGVSVRVKLQENIQKKFLNCKSGTFKYIVKEQTKKSDVMQPESPSISPQVSSSHLEGNTSLQLVSCSGQGLTFVPTVLYHIPRQKCIANGYKLKYKSLCYTLFTE